MHKKINWLLLVLLLLCTTAQTQTTREQQLEKVKQELKLYLDKNAPLPVSAETEKKIQEQLAGSEVKYTEESRKQEYERLKVFFIENNFWNSNPEYYQLASKRQIGNTGSLCRNGGFENGNTAFTHSAGLFSATGSNNCVFARTIPFNPTFNNSPINSVARKMEIVTSGNDPVVAALTRTHSGNNALRINSNISDDTSNYRNCINFNREIDKASVSFTVTSGARSLSFWYAAVLQKPEHNDSSGGNPFFTARLRDEVTGATQSVCLDPSMQNLVTAIDNCNGGNNIKYQPWRCDSFDLRGLEGHEVTLEFIAADCRRGNHFGYAYVDDICMGCNSNQFPWVNVQSGDACFTDGYQFSGSYHIPPAAGMTFQRLTIDLWRNGVRLQQNIPITINNGFFQGTVPFNILTPGQSYDLVVSLIYNTPNGTVTLLNEIRNGRNNDFTPNGAPCCVNPTPPPTAFTVQTVNNNGVFTVTVTSPVPAPANHWWGLMETRIAGNTQDNVTIGEAQPVQAGAGLNRISFTITDLCKAYYIKHGIWLDGCYFWQEERVPLSLPGIITNSFRFEDKYKEPRNGFCFGEDVYINASASTGEHAYSIQLSRKPIGSTGSFVPFGNSGWLTGSLDNLVNVSAIFAAQTPALYLEQGFEYQFTLLLASDTGCANQVAQTKTFELPCCTTGANADFKLMVKPIANGFRIDATLSNIFTGNFSGAVHTWRLASSSTRVGPYRIISHTTQPGFSFMNARNGLYYYIIHEVFSACGNYCFAQQVYIQNNNWVIEQADCSLLNTIWGICDVPKNLTTSCKTNMLSWTAVPYITGYQVEVTTNGPGCCRNGSGTPVTTSYTTSANSLPVANIRNGVNSCFSWRVLAVCKNGQSEWSAPQCYNCNPTILTPGPGIKPVRQTGGR